MRLLTHCLQFFWNSQRSLGCLKLGLGNSLGYSRTNVSGGFWGQWSWWYVLDLWVLAELNWRTTVRLATHLGHQFIFLKSLCVDASCWWNVVLLIDIHNLHSMRVSERYCKTKDCSSELLTARWFGNVLTKLDTGATAVESLFVIAPFGSARYLLFLKFNCILTYLAEVVEPGAISENGLEVIFLPFQCCSIWPGRSFFSSVAILTKGSQTNWVYLRLNLVLELGLCKFVVILE